MLFVFYSAVKMKNSPIKEMRECWQIERNREREIEREREREKDSKRERETKRESKRE